MIKKSIFNTLVGKTDYTDDFFYRSALHIRQFFLPAYFRTIFRGYLFSESYATFQIASGHIPMFCGKINQEVGVSETRVQFLSGSLNCLAWCGMHAVFEKLSQQKARGVINQVAKHVAWLLYSVFGWVGRLVVGWGCYSTYRCCCRIRCGYYIHGNQSNSK